ncbi:MAG TPA: gluconokinase [Jatrophihabitans sp.]|jgi:gluconokinase/shikimate kinase
MTVLVVMGVSGTGKSTLAGMLAARLDWDLCEGDDLHPPENIAKMAAGIPLTDADRIPWLERVGAWIREHVDVGRSGIVTCSALKRSYRDVLRGPDVRFVWLDGTRDQLVARLTARVGHYMPVALLDSQLDALEPPGTDENAIRVDIAAPVAEEADEVVAALTPQQ